MPRITKEHEGELIKLYGLGESPSDLAEKYPYKRGAIKELMRRRGVVRSQSEASKLAVKKGKKDKAIKILTKLARTTYRFHPKKSNFGKDNGNYLDVGSIVGVHKNKYRKIKLKDHSWKYYHIHLIEKKLGRRLKKNEVVHHIDFDGTNNNLNNLIVLDKKEHMHLHNVKMNNLIHELYENGIIRFDKGLKEYVSIRK